MKLTYTLGRSIENDIVIDNPCVGRKHLNISFRSVDELLIEDLESSNNTYVNGIRVKKKLVNVKDTIALGTYIVDTQSLFSDIVKRYNESRTDFSKEFDSLKKIYEDYERKVAEFKRKSQIFPMLIRTLVTLSIMGMVFFFISDPQVRYPLMTVAGVAGGIISIVLQRESRLKDQIDILTAELELVYRCPKCGKSLISRRWQHWASKKECENCGAKWSI